MAYTNETTHFGFPLPLGTDLTVPMDYNESLEEADTALYEAQTNAAGAVGTAGNALTVANEAKSEAQSATSAAASATATAQAAATAANEAVAAVAEAKDDALDMICAVVEDTATAQYKHEPTKDGLNYYFRYNDILYKTTAVINVGETIVPNTNCAATNVATELEAGAAAGTASDVSYSNTTSGLSATNVQTAIDEVVEEQSKNNYGTAVAITSTITAVDSDGYISVGTDQGQSCIVRIYAADDTSYTSTLTGIRLPEYGGTFIPIKKGMQVKSEGTFSYCNFIPLV